MKYLVILLLYVSFPITLLCDIELRFVKISNVNNGSSGTMTFDLEAKSNDGNDISITKLEVRIDEDGGLKANYQSVSFSNQLFTAPAYNILKEEYSEGSGPNVDFLRIDYRYLTGTKVVIGHLNWTKIYRVAITYTLSDGSTTDFSFSDGNCSISATPSVSLAYGTVDNSDLSPAPLPVELTSFTGEILNEEVTLSWKTETEINNYGFEVERMYQEKRIKNQETSEKSQESISEYQDWDKLGFVEGHGNSNSPKYYSFSDKSISEAGKYFYRLKQVDIDGKYEYSDVVEVVLNVSSEFKLEQNYPNPFNPVTTIKYTIPSKIKSETSNVKLVVYDILGSEIAALVNESQQPGNYEVDWNAEQLNSGIYFYKLQVGNYIDTKRMILMK